MRVRCGMRGPRNDSMSSSQCRTSEVADSARPREHLSRLADGRERPLDRGQRQADSGRVGRYGLTTLTSSMPRRPFGSQDPHGQVVPVGPEYRMAGQYVREWYGNHEVIVLSTTSKTVGFNGSPSDPDQLRRGLWRRSASHRSCSIYERATSLPSVRAQLARPWLFRMHTMFQHIVPRQAADAIVYFDQVTATKDQ